MTNGTIKMTNARYKHTIISSERAKSGGGGGGAMTFFTETVDAGRSGIEWKYKSVHMHLLSNCTYGSQLDNTKLLTVFIWIIAFALIFKILHDQNVAHIRERCLYNGTKYVLTTVVRFSFIIYQCCTIYYNSTSKIYYKENTNYNWLWGCI